MTVTAGWQQHPAAECAPVRGRVLDLTEHGAAEHIDQLAQKYLGRPYPWFGGRDQTRVIMKIEAEKISSTR